MRIVLLFLIGFLGMIPWSSHAQWSIGVKGGYTKAWQEYGNLNIGEEEIHIEGIHATLLFYYQVNKYLSVGIEPGYTRRGAIRKPWFSNFNSDTTLVLNYLALPMQIQMSMPVLEGKFSLTGQLGYGPAIALSGYRNITIPDNVNNVIIVENPYKQSLDFNSASTIARWEHGIYTGFGLSYALGSGQLLLQTNYYFGATDISPHYISRNRTSQVSIGYLLDL